MSYELVTTQSVMLTPEAVVEIGEPRKLSGSDTWVIHISANGWPKGSSHTTYFGTEEQVRAIAAGYPVAADTPDPAQLDALEVAEAGIE
jgi:hypothetical protein